MLFYRDYLILLCKVVPTPCVPVETLLNSENTLSAMFIGEVLGKSIHFPDHLALNGVLKIFSYHLNLA